MLTALTLRVGTGATSGLAGLRVTNLRAVLRAAVSRTGGPGAGFSSCDEVESDVHVIRSFSFRDWLVIRSTRMHVSRAAPTPACHSSGNM